jgi:tricorn protease-like protein
LSVTKAAFLIAVGLVACSSCELRGAQPVSKTIPACEGIEFSANLDYDPAWSFDGRWIVYRRVLPSADGPAGLYIVSWLGGQPRFVYPGSFLEPRNPRFSPDGRYLAASTITDIIVIDIESGALIHRVHHDDGLDYPDWSPDGRWVSYQVTGLASYFDPPDSGLFRLWCG